MKSFAVGVIVGALACGAGMVLGGTHPEWGAGSVSKSLAALVDGGSGGCASAADIGRMRTVDGIVQVCRW